MNMPPRPLQLSRLARQAGAVAALGVFFAIAGPFGTYGDLGVVTRYTYWIGLCLVGYVSIVVAAHAIHALRRADGPWALAAVALASSVPTTLAVAWVESVTRLGKPVALSVMPKLYLSVVAIQLVVVLFLTRVRFALGPLLLYAPPAQAPVQASAFLDRLPAHLGTELLSLEAEDHYLRVSTPLGSDLILMRLGDALRELGPELGMQVHRSWWVAFAAVVGSRREDGKFMLVLSNGQMVPVSRTYAAAVRAAIPSLAEK